MIVGQIDINSGCREKNAILKYSNKAQNTADADEKKTTACALRNSHHECRVELVFFVGAII